MFDDHHVKLVDEKTVLNQVPYMCFYLRTHCEYLNGSPDPVDPIKVE
jgi:hypothetical protein